MSSNNNIPVLTRTNYEEAFLLYVDNELTPAEKNAVDDFVRQHPDLKEELDLLCSATFSADDLSFNGKEALFADSMKLHTVDESLLLYIDNELPQAEIEKVETQLEKDEAFALQHALLLKTKLDASEQIIYPYKKELYRRTERRIAPYWLRIAAAVVLVTGTGTAAWLNMDNSNSADVNVAVATPKNTTPQSAPPTTAPAKQIETPVANESGKSLASSKVTAPQKTVAKKDIAVKPQAPVVAKRTIKKEPTPTFLKTHIADDNVVAKIDVPVGKSSDAAISETDAVSKKIVPVLDKAPVTSEAASAYVTKDAAAKTTVPVNAVALEDGNERNGGSVKSFLRKATRFIERRTGIKTVNDDDELLVGAVALKL